MKTRVIVVDDEPLCLGATSDSLTALGYEPRPYANSIMAIVAIKAVNSKFERVIVMSDVQMPDANGFTVARACRDANIPCVLVSETWNETSLAVAMSVAAYAIQKPYTLALLEDIIGHVACDADAHQRVCASYGASYSWPRRRLC